MKILITGGAGFLGYHLAQSLRDHDLVLLDIAPFNTAEIPESVQTVQADVRDAAAMRQALANCDAVVHAAAGLPLWKPQEICSVNLEGTRNVLQAAKDLKTPRVIHISSTAVYGIPEHHPLNEADPMHGVGPYGKSKVQAEILCQRARQNGQWVSILRPKTFIGPERLGVFQILYDWVSEGRRIPVIGSGNNRYQLLAVEDLVSAIQLVIQSPDSKANQTLNVGATRYGTVAEDLKSLFNHAGTGSRVFPVPALPAKFALRMLEAARLSPLYKWIYATADQDSYVSTDRLQELGWQAKFSNAGTLIATWDWYQLHKSQLPPAGVGHRVPWSEGALRLLRRWM